MSSLVCIKVPPRPSRVAISGVNLGWHLDRMWGDYEYT